jgi:hypothetical protein
MTLASGSRRLMTMAFGGRYIIDRISKVGGLTAIIIPPTLRRTPIKSFLYRIRSALKQASNHCKFVRPCIDSQHRQSLSHHTLPNNSVATINTMTPSDKNTPATFLSLSPTKSSPPASPTTTKATPASVAPAPAVEIKESARRSSDSSTSSTASAGFLKLGPVDHAE